MQAVCARPSLSCPCPSLSNSLPGPAPLPRCSCVQASLLEYARSLAEAAADGAPTSDCVLTVPSYFTPGQRQALLDAAKLAGLNVMGLIHSHAAAALQYGIERDFANRTENVIFYDMGSGTVEAALVKFSAYKDKKVCVWCGGGPGGTVG